MNFIKFLKSIFDFLFKTPVPIPPAEDGADIPDTDTTVRIDSIGPLPPTPAPKITLRPKRYCWMIDNGHGVDTPGKRSPVLPNGMVVIEAEVARNIGKIIVKKLRTLGITYYLVVPEENDISLNERVRRMESLKNKLPKLGISLHSNAGNTPTPQHFSTASGIEVWHYHTSTNGKKMAKVFLRHLVQATGWTNRGTKSRPKKQFTLLKKTTFPFIFGEHGFHNNKQEAQKLASPQWQYQIAEAYVAAIVEIETNGL